MKKLSLICKPAFLKILFVGLILFFSTKHAVATSYSWTNGFLGLGDGKWSTSSNWVPNGVPGSGDDVTLNDVILGFTVTLTSPVTVNSILVNGVLALGFPAVINTNGNSLTVNSSLNVGGFSLVTPTAISFTGSGLVTLKTAINVYPFGSVTFDTGSNTTIAGTIVTSYNNSTISNKGTLTANSSTFNVSGGSCTITNSGIFNLGVASVINLTGTSSSVSNTGTFTLLSNASGSATIGSINSTSSGFTGQYSVQRFLSGGTGFRGYRILSSPVNAGTVGTNKVYSINYIATSTYVSGSGFGTSATTMAGNPSFYLYRENLAPLYSTFLNSNNRGIKSISGSPNYTIDSDPVNTDAGNFNIPIGDGFLYFFRGGIGTINPYNSSSTPVAATPVATGILNQGPVQVVNWNTPTSTSLGYTVIATPGTGNAAVRGLNMVGNPYASSIDLTKFDSTAANATTTGIYGVGIMSTIWELKPGTNTYGIYNVKTKTPGLNGGSNIIASGQGFFVKATRASATLTFNESAKTLTLPSGFTYLASTLVASVAYSQYMILNIAKDTTSKMEILIGYNDSSSKKYNEQEDDLYFPGQSAPQYLWITSNDNYNLVSKWMTLPKAKQADTVNVNVWATASGQYAINRTTLNAIPNLYDIWLMDKYKKDSVNLKQTASYPFNIDLNDTASYSAHRFIVVTRQNPALALQLLDFTAAKATGGVQINWKTANEEDYTNFTVERSIDNGTTFTSLTNLLSDSEGTYSYLDTKPVPATDAYRLKMKGPDSTVTYSKVVTISYSAANNIAATSAINVYPNPASNTINLSIKTSENTNTVSQGAQQSLNAPPSLSATQTADSYNIKIINVMGSVVKSATSSQPTWQDNVSNLSPGTYVIQVLNNTNKSLIGKATFVKL